MIGKIYLLNQEFRKASYYITKALLSRPTKSRTVSLYALILVQLGEVDKALLILKQCRYSGDCEVIENIVVVYLLIGQFHEAEVVLRKASTLCDNSEELKVLSDQVYSELRIAAQSGDSGEKYIPIYLRPKEPYVYFKDSEEGSNKLEQRMRLDETNRDEFVRKLKEEGIHHFRMGLGHLLLAKNVFELCMAEDLQDPYYPWMIGKIYLINQEPEKAEKYLRKAMELDPENKEYKSKYGISLIRIGKVKDALSIAIDIREGNAYTIDNIGMIFLLAGRLQEAKVKLAYAAELAHGKKFTKVHEELIERELADQAHRVSAGKLYTPLYLRQKMEKRFFDEEKDTRYHEEVDKVLGL